MKIYESIVSEALLAHFQNPSGKTLMNHATNACGIDESLALVAVFWPRTL